MDKSLILPPWISDNAILQRGVEVKISGRYRPRSSITARLAGGVKRIKTDDKGSFVFSLKPKQAGETESISFFEGDLPLVSIKNLLYGDVYVFGGQSNIEWPLINTIEGYAEYKNPFENQEIREFFIPKLPFESAAVEYPEFYTEETRWQIATSLSIPHFSAIAWQVAKANYIRTRVPQGIVSCYWGGTSVAAWIPYERVKSHPILKTYTNEYESLISQWSPKDLLDHKMAYRNYLEFAKKYYETKGKTLRFDPANVRDFLTVDLPGSDKTWPPPLGPHSFLRPGGLYPTMSKKLEGLRVAGVVWYQGESDAGLGLGYEDCLKCLVTEWNLLFGGRSPHWYIVQLPGFDCEPRHTWALTRLAQARFVESTKSATLICSIDCGEKSNIHPLSKKTISHRISATMNQKSRSKAMFYPAVNVDRARLVLDFGARLKPIEGLKRRVGLTLKDEGGALIDYEALVKDSQIILNLGPKAKIPKTIELYMENWPIEEGEDFLYFDDGLPLMPFSINL